MTPTFTDAARRVRVRIVRPNMPVKFGTLVAVPGGKQWTAGAKAKVQLVTGSYICVPVDQLEIIDEVTT